MAGLLVNPVLCAEPRRGAWIAPVDPGLPFPPDFSPAPEEPARSRGSVRLCSAKRRCCKWEDMSTANRPTSPATDKALLRPAVHLLVVDVCTEAGDLIVQAEMECVLRGCTLGTRSSTELGMETESFVGQVGWFLVVGFTVGNLERDAECLVHDPRADCCRPCCCRSARRGYWGWP